MSATIALVDDDRNILTSVSIALQAEGFVTRVYSDGETALKALVDNPPDLAVLDVKMPRMDGMELLRRLREKSALPVIFLTSKDEELDEALGLAMGADDYIAKPFSQRLLIARIRAILRRTELRAALADPDGGEAEPAQIVRGRLAMDPARHRVDWDGHDVTLTVTEFMILEALAQRPGVVKSRNQLMDVAYQDDIYVDDRTIDSHIKRLRRKFRAVDNEFKAIETLYGVGYRFERNDESDLTVRWSRRWMLLHRILAVNVFALAILAGSLFYLDGFRGRLTAAAVANAETEVRIIADSLAVSEPAEKEYLIRRLGQDSRARLRVYAPDGRKQMDSWNGVEPSYELRDPKLEGWRKDIARLLDRGFDAIVGAPELPVLTPPAHDRLEAWPEAVDALKAGASRTMIRKAPEGTHYISAAAAVGGTDAVLLSTRNAREIRRVVRDERMTLGIILAITLAVSILLSLFLARTIALPLRRLARAAHRVRLGRARDVTVPLLPARRDEIGLLARALHDMTQSLRDRIDATEAFAADVTHELKNPLASLRSAVESLGRIEDPALRAQLLAVVESDVARLDRLVVDIAEASRLDAELSRARFEPVDIGALIESLLGFWEPRAAERQVRIAFGRPGAGTALVMGEETRLARAIDNLVDNALSFSPEGGLIEIVAVCSDGEVVVIIADEGPGVAPDQREAVFGRFHSMRPDGEDFGRHSGLGLAIVRATAKGHGGTVSVEDRHDGRPGARFVLRLPVATE